MKINNSTSNNYLRVLGKSSTIINETSGGSNTPADSSVFENYSSTYLNQSKIDQLRLNVPQEIQNSSKFCPVKTPVYRDDNRRLQIRKTPCDLTGKAVSGYKSCLAFDEVAIPNKKVNAISMVLPEKCEGYAVIDIDDCIVNGKLDPTHPRFDVIDELLKTLDTYFEISMSGKGLHGIIGVYGGKPEFITRTRNDYFELYFEKRVIILTGNLLLGKSSKIQWLSLEKMKNVYDLIGLNTKPISKIMTSSKPQNVQNRVYELSDSKNLDDVLANLRKYPLSAELLDGDWRNTRYPTKSDADQGLAYFSAIQSKCDKSLILGAMYRSNLYIEDKNGKNKWDSREDYLDRTIKRAIDLVCQQNPEMVEYLKTCKEVGLE